MVELIAMLSMLIDHIGVVFFPDIPFFRIIGRIAFPLYAWGIVQGLKHTRNLKNYQKRLLWLAMLSQIPYMMIAGLRLNVIFTFLLCIVVLKLLERGKIINYVFVILIAIFAHFFSDYGAYAITLLLIYKYLKGYYILISHIFLDLFFAFVFGWILQPLSILATIIILNRNKLRKVKMNRWFYRSFYPAHLAVLVLIKGGI